MANKENIGNKQQTNGKAGVPNENQPSQVTRKKTKKKVYQNRVMCQSKRQKLAQLQEGTPNLIPVRTEGYDLSNKILGEYYSLSSSSSVYQIWLNCLYENDVEYATIISELGGLLNKEQKMSLTKARIFIAAYQEENRYMRPAGSCLLVFRRSATQKNFEEISDKKILDSGVHMTCLDLIYLRNQLKQKNYLIFADGFPNLVSKISIGALKKFRKQSGAPISNPSSSNRTPAEPENSIKQPSDIEQPKILQSKEDKENVKSQVREDPPKPPKSKRIAATLDGLKNNQAPEKAKTKVKGPIDLATFEAQLFDKLQIDVDKRDYVGDMLPKLAKFGTAVLRIENLPAKLSIHAFNLMMGTYSIKCDQLIAVNVPGKGGRDTMNLRLVTIPNSNDFKQIIGKDKRKTVYDTVLRIEPTNFKELEKFMATHKDRIRHLDDDLIPNKSATAISYGSNVVKVI